MKVKKIWQKPVFFVGVSFDVRSNAVFVVRATVENGNCCVGAAVGEGVGFCLKMKKPRFAVNASRGFLLMKFFKPLKCVSEIQKPLVAYCKNHALPVCCK